MKNKILMIGLVLGLLVGCTKKNNPEEAKKDRSPEHVKTDYSGCFLEYGNKDRDILTDTIYYEERNDTLILNMSMVRNCAACLNDSLNIVNDSVNIFVTDTCLPIANCICDFAFEYYFTEYGDTVIFNVYVNSKWEPEYVLWKELMYP